MVGVMLVYLLQPIDQGQPGAAPTGGMPWGQFMAVTLGVLGYLLWREWSRRAVTSWDT